LKFKLTWILSGNQTIEEIAMEKGVSVDELEPSLAKAAVVIGPEIACMTPDELDTVLVYVVPPNLSMMKK